MLLFSAGISIRFITEKGEVELLPFLVLKFAEGKANSQLSVQRIGTAYNLDQLVGD